MQHSQWRARRGLVTAAVVAVPLLAAALAFGLGTRDPSPSAAPPIATPRLRALWAGNATGASGAGANGAGPSSAAPTPADEELAVAEENTPAPGLVDSTGLPDALNRRDLE